MGPSCQNCGLWFMVGGRPFSFGQPKIYGMGEKPRFLFCFCVGSSRGTRIGGCQGTRIGATTPPQLRRWCVRQFGSPVKQRKQQQKAGTPQPLHIQSSFGTHPIVHFQGDVRIKKKVDPKSAPKLSWVSCYALWMPGIPFATPVGSHMFTRLLSAPLQKVFHF